jgi:hypothetical protein
LTLHRNAQVNKVTHTPQHGKPATAKVAADAAKTYGATETNHDSNNENQPLLH